MRYMRKYNESKGLKDIEVLVNDTVGYSRYFEVHDFPEGGLTAGKNLFKIQGNQSLLKPGSEVLVEILDRNGNTIYHEIVDYIEEDTQQRVVSIYVYPDTPSGFAKVYICGVANSRPNGSSIPPGFQNKMNVRWEKRVVVRPRRENTSEIILTQSPRLSIMEKMKTYVVPVEGTADLHYEFSGSNFRFDKQTSTQANREGLSWFETNDYVISSTPFFSS